jgi:hypothetical protein
MREFTILKTKYIGRRYKSIYIKSTSGAQAEHIESTNPGII